jgi:thiosulfate/3-mercaptopyruvate sulfurtransferase
MGLYQTVISTLFVLALTGCAVISGTSPKGLEVPIEKAAVRFSADLQTGGYRVISTSDLKQWLDEGRDITIISTLPVAGERVSGILPGSVNAEMPLLEQDLAPEDREHMLMAAGSDKQRILVVYSGFVACRRSHIGAKMLVEMGYKNVYRYPAGLMGWSEAGYLSAK